MQLIASILLLNAGALAAVQPAKSASLAPRTSPARPVALGINARQSCDEQLCADVCIPMDAMCCDVIVGIYCEAGETCTTQNTCCVDGLNCNTDIPVGVECSSDEIECGVACIPADAECCDPSLTSYCEAGTTCLSSATCDLSGGSNDDDEGDTDFDDIFEDDDDDSENDNNDNSSSNDDNNDDDDNSSSNNNSSNDDDDNSNSNNNGNSNDDEDGAGFSLHPSLAMVIFGAALTMLF